MFKRIHLIVMDSVGIGAAKDAEQYNDLGSHTLGHIAEERGLMVPNLTAMGLGAIAPLKGVPAEKHQFGYAGKLAEESAGKDTMTGHWEIAGLQINTPFRVFPDGFPKELLQKIEKFSKRKILCNQPYSGTAVIDDYGVEHLRTGGLIVYTSADPVLQIAAHEEVVPLEELYRICEYVRSITKEDPYMIGRIIARPFTGAPGSFSRTANRHDYALAPFDKTILDALKDKGFETIAIGKIADIFDNQGITQSVRTVSNMDGVDQLLQVMTKDFTGLSFTNLVDFDALYGHRRDVEGYGAALEAFDQRLPELLDRLELDDLLLITADHGNDPTFPGTDHTREFVPLLAYSKQMTGSGGLSQGNFADISALIAENFQLSKPAYGRSFLHKIIG